jgi:hypothetical protein
VSLSLSAYTTSGGIENFSWKDTPQFRAKHATENRATGPLSTSRLRSCIIAMPGLCEWLGVDRDGPLRCSGPIEAHSRNWESSLVEEFSMSESCCLPCRAEGGPKTFRRICPLPSRRCQPAMVGLRLGPVPVLVLGIGSRKSDDQHAHGHEDIFHVHEKKEQRKVTSAVPGE